MARSGSAPRRRRTVGGAGAWWRWAAVAGLALLAAPAAAFDAFGHEVTEARAYRLLLDLPATAAGPSGKEVLARLIARGVLDPPRCWGATPAAGGDACAQSEDALDWLPVLGAAAPDLILTRQLADNGQCFHFMAHSSDLLGPGDRNGADGLPAGNVARERCVALLTALVDELARDPVGAREENRGAYALVHAVQDSYSPAHVERAGAAGPIARLKVWRVTAWPLYGLHWEGFGRFWEDGYHHPVFAASDHGYLDPDVVVTVNGRATYCGHVVEPYAVPLECLTPVGRVAVGAVADLLLTLAKVVDAAPGAAREAAWWPFVDAHLAGKDAPPAARGRLQGFTFENAEWHPRVHLGVRVDLRDPALVAFSLGERFFGVPWFEPLVLELEPGIGERRFGDLRGWTGFAGLGLAAPVLDGATISVPFVRAAALLRDPGVTEIEVPLLRVHAFLLRRIWVGLEAFPYSFAARHIQERVSLTLGVAADVALLDRLSRLRTSGREERREASGAASGWRADGGMTPRSPPLSFALTQYPLELAVGRDEAIVSATQAVGLMTARGIRGTQGPSLRYGVAGRSAGDGAWLLGVVGLGWRAESAHGLVAWTPEVVGAYGPRLFQHRTATSGPFGRVGLRWAALAVTLGSLEIAVAGPEPAFSRNRSGLHLGQWASLRLGARR